MTTSKLLHTVLEKDFELYQKAHHYHWNVEGNGFIQFHGFFGDLYDSTYDQIDVIAEHIRALGDKVSFSGLKVNVLNTANPIEMVSDLKTANDSLTTALNTAFKSAQKDNNQGLMNYLADRIDAQAKWNWQLTSITKEKKADTLKESETIVDINGFSVIKENDMYCGFVTNDKYIRSETKHSTLAGLVEELTK